MRSSSAPLRARSRCSPRSAGLVIAALGALTLVLRRLAERWAWTPSAASSLPPPPPRASAPFYSREPGPSPPSHSSDVAFLHDAPPAGESLDAFAPARELPLLAVFVRAGTSFLTRFAESIDFPVRELLVVQDGADDASVTLAVERFAARLAGPAPRKIRRVRHVVNARRTGCAEGGWSSERAGGQARGVAERPY
jgi:hypothetical protein